MRRQARQQVTVDDQRSLADPEVGTDVVAAVALQIGDGIGEGTVVAAAQAGAGR